MSRIKFTVETWAPDFGASVEASTEEEVPNVLTEVEIADDQWGPLTPPSQTVEKVFFVDGVRRIDANIWLEPDPNHFKLGLCASYAAGIIQCTTDSATIVEERSKRGLFTEVTGMDGINTPMAHYPLHITPGENTAQLIAGVQQQMRQLEWEITEKFQTDEGLIIRDGPLSAPQTKETIGYIKRHYVHYLPESHRFIFSQLQPGSRTPLFLTTHTWKRFSWYLRLPTSQPGTMSGIVRGEVAEGVGIKRAIVLADLMSAVLPRFASAEHKEARAPQNLYPIAGLETSLRHKLGDKELLYRHLRQSAA